MIRQPLTISKVATKNKTLIISAAVALAAIGGIVIYKASAGPSTPPTVTEQRIQSQPGPSSTMKDWNSLSAADKAYFDKYVAAMESATTAAQMRAAQSTLMTDDDASKKAHSYNVHIDPRLSVLLSLVGAYRPKRVSLGLPAY